MINIWLLFSIEVDGVNTIDDVGTTECSVGTIDEHTTEQSVKQTYINNLHIVDGSENVILPVTVHCP